MADYRFVDSIPDLIQPEDYASDPQGRRLRLRIRTSAEGVEILGDAQRPALIEELLAELEGVVIEQMLCG
jgi:FtsH ternary system-associated peptide